MSVQYTDFHLKLAIGRILEILGWNSVQSTSLEILSDLLARQIRQIARNTIQYANEFGQTIPNLDHLGMALREMNVDMAGLIEYVQNINYTTPLDPTPELPVTKYDELNFLKPGSQEVVTRPLYIHEHLPPMESPATAVTAKNDVPSDEELLTANEPVMSVLEPVKEEEVEEELPNKTIELQNAALKSAFDQHFNINNHEGIRRPARELTSVTMTSSGFLSPAREGKLPEARTPVSLLETNLNVKPPLINDDETDIMPPPPPPPRLTNMQTSPTVSALPAEPSEIEVSCPVLVPNTARKRVKVVRRTDKKKEKSAPKEQVKKPRKKRSASTSLSSAPPVKIPKRSTNTKSLSSHDSKMNRALAAARLKTEKLNTTITPVVVKPTKPRKSNSRNNKATIIPLPLDAQLATENIKLDSVEKEQFKPNRTKNLSNIKTDNFADEMLHKKVEDIFVGSNDVRDIPLPLPLSLPLRAELPPSISPSMHSIATSAMPEELCAKLSQLSSDITIEPIPPSNAHDDEGAAQLIPDCLEVEYYENADENKPKTPEIMLFTPSSAAITGKKEEKQRKRRERSSKRPKKFQKSVPKLSLKTKGLHEHNMFMPVCNSQNGIFDGESMVHGDRPKTPDPVLQTFNKMNFGPAPHMPVPGLIPPMTFPFFPNFSGPGLIPNNPLFQQLPFPPLGLANLVQKPLVISTPPNSLSRESSPPRTPGSNLVVNQVKEVPPFLCAGEPNLLDVAIRPSSSGAPAELSAADSTTINAREMKENAKRYKREKKERKRRKREKLEKRRLKKERLEKLKKAEERKEIDINAPAKQNVKLTLRLDTSMRHTEPLKICIKPIIKPEEHPNASATANSRSPSTSAEPIPSTSRAPSPGLAKISALVNGPPKPKVKQQSPASYSDHNASSCSYYIPPRDQDRTDGGRSTESPGQHQHKHKLRIKETRSYTELPIDSPLPQSKYIDEQGNEVWICPACSRQDDGTAMIGCDLCDAWYHWTCVGVTVEPSATENWYCQHCLTKMDEEKQKKKRKKRTKKE